MYKLITFDMYSAILDINGSAIPMVQNILNTTKEESTKFFHLWRSQQWNYLLLSNSMNKGFKSYQYLTEQVLEYTRKKLDVQLSHQQKKELMDVWVNFKPWPEAKMVVDELKARNYKVGMLSNGDEQMLKPLQESSGIIFDYIFSADQVASYKPSADIYSRPLETLGINKHEMLHVAGSLFDVMGAKSAQFNCAWSNRYQDFVLDDFYQPDHNMKNLSELLTIL